MKINDNFDIPNILIVDDKPENIIAFTKIIDDMNCNIIKATSGNEALEKLLYNEMALILLDVNMPEMNGFETAELIRGTEETKSTPIIFITAYSNEKSYIFKGYETGAVDFMTQPIEPSHLRNKVKVFVDLFTKKNELAGLLVIQESISEKLLNTSSELNKVNNRLEEEIKKRKRAERKLKKINKQLDEISRTDPLTGLSNRRDILEKLAYECDKIERTKRNFCLILSDIDHFKAINDTYGHDCGDYTLVEISKILQKYIRKHDIASRWGGEEFLIFMPETDINEGKSTAERIRSKIESSNLKYKNNKISITMSFGISEYEGLISLHECISIADKKLYKAKESGRNKVIF